MLSTVVTLHLDVQLLAMVGGVVIPALTALVTKKQASGGLKWVVLTLLAAVGGVVANLVTLGGNFSLYPTLSSMGITWVTSLAAHYGFSVSGVQEALESVAPGVGLGATPKALPVAAVPKAPDVSGGGGAGAAS